MNKAPLIILPTYNESENLRPLTTAILEQGPFDILVVDDNSPDGTGHLADMLAEEYKGHFFVLHRAGKLGLGTAYCEGFRWGLAHGYDLLFEMDADFSHSPEHLPQFLRAISGGADIVLGSRYIDGGVVRNWSALRRLVSRGGSIYARAILGLPFHDLTGGFKCFRRRALEKLDLDTIRSNGYSFQIEMTYRAFQQRLRIAEIPIMFHDRRVGQSKMSRRIVYEAVLMVWRLRFAKAAVRADVLSSFPDAAPKAYPVSPPTTQRPALKFARSSSIIESERET